MVAPFDPRRLQQFWMCCDWITDGRTGQRHVASKAKSSVPLLACNGFIRLLLLTFNNVCTTIRQYHTYPFTCFLHSCWYFLGSFCVCVSASLFAGPAIVGCLLLPRCRYGSTLIIIISLAKVRLCWWLPHVCFPLLASNTTLRCAAYGRSDIASALWKVSNLCWSLSFLLSHK